MYDTQLDIMTLVLDERGNFDSTPEMENLTGAASHGRKLHNSKGQALEASIVQYCDKWCHILI